MEPIKGVQTTKKKILQRQDKVFKQGRLHGLELLRLYSHSAVNTGEKGVTAFRIFGRWQLFDLLALDSQSRDT